MLSTTSRIDPPPSGTSTTNGTAGRTVSIGSTLPDADYAVTIEPNVDGGDFGPWEIPAATKTTSNFVIKNSGASGLAFTWTLIRR